ncbi:oligosaccharide flippase family protein, partial [Enterococcus malodoratus]|uniref:oligosaccharide flippase family protein n=1 Tax=Enterococcus malodoratus TaxID=71451 RepID=UPI0022E40868
NLNNRMDFLIYTKYFTLSFSLDRNKDIKEVFSNSMFISMIGVVIMIFSIPLFKICNVDYSIYIISILIAQSFQMLFSQYAKAIDKINIFAVNGIILSFLTAGLNILFLVIFNFGIHGYLLSVLVATIISDIGLWIVLALHKNIDVKKISKKGSKELLKYSIPLIPNGIAWWITNTVSRYFILFFLNTAANGIFAVANKIPSLLNILNTIFFQAWQLSAIEEFNSEDSSNFYSKIFSLYSKFLFIGMSGILLILKPLMNLLVSKEYFISWKFVPFLLLTVIYSSFSSFLGHYYAASKQTMKVFTTTVLGSVISILGNIVLIPMIGLNGAGISSSISFFIIWLIRLKDTKRFVKTSIDVPNLVKNHLFIFIQIAGLYLLNGIGLGIWEISCLIIVLIVNRELIFTLFQMLFHRKTI